MPHKFHDGHGNEYVRPIRHVAITDYPVVPGLDKFKPIAAGFSLSEEGTDMQPTLAELATALGVEVPDGASDEEIFQAIVAAKGERVEDESGLDDEDFDLPENVDEGDDSEGDADDPEGEGEEDETSDEADSESDDSSDDEYTDDEGVLPRRKAKAKEMSHMPAVTKTQVSREVKHRTAEIDGLFRERKINKELRDELVKEFADPKTVNVALAHETLGADGDGFERTIKMLSLNSPAFSTGEKSGHQAQKPEENILNKNAQRRAEAAKAHR
jgi:hypothetical protein